ncbi:MAG TPA: APC family permease, partial [Dehalococcoidia bacterium]|nr:APC family permease [Dehalococcoidia bacterium]
KGDDLERYGRYRVPRPGAGALQPEVELHEIHRGAKPGSRYYRLTPSRQQKLRRIAPGEFEATRAVLRPTTRLGRVWFQIRRILIGEPLATAELPHERLSKLKALAVYSSDNLSSSAYATEEILIILMAAGTAALSKSIPITIALVALIAIVVTSYRQTIRAYPNGGGAYIVATDNLGLLPGLVAGSALMVDYILTVSVSIAAGVAAITSAIPDLLSLKIELALAFVALITLANLRGIRESGTIFAIPTYFFIVTFGGMLAVGLLRVAFGADLVAREPSNPIEPGQASLSLFLMLRAFSSGAVALSGIEAVANGVPNFKPPEWKNAVTVQAWMVTILTAFFVSTTVLAHQFHVIPSETETVVSQIARTVFGENILYYLVQAGTMLILILAANTAFADLPVLASVMARNGVMPKQFAFRGDRLAFSYGIILLGLASSGILLIFGAETTRIIPLYAFGVFTAFTLSQFGMVEHWRRNRQPGWRTSMFINAFGGTATLVVAMIVGATKFTHGAWLSMAVMALLVVILWRVRAHYLAVKAELALVPATEPPTERSFRAAVARTQAVLVPVDEINRAVLRTVAYARTISDNVTALHVTDDREEAEALRRRWEELVPDVPLVIVESPYRSLVAPVLAYVDALDRTQPDQMVTVVLPEFVVRWPWQRLLHNQLAVRLKKALIGRPNTVVVDVPYHLRA